MNQFSLEYKISIILLLVLVCIAIFFYIRNFKIFDTTTKTSYLVLLLSLSVIFYFQTEKSHYFEKLKKDYDVTKGKIESYFVPNIKGGIPSMGQAPQSNRVVYYYYVNGVAYANSLIDNPYIYLPDSKPNLNINYLIIFEVGNPKNSFILLNYPIEKESDFDEYKKVFKEGIPLGTFRR